MTKKITEISGRGIGLDVVNTIIKQLGGSLVISSAINVGTNFSIKLPFTSSLNHGLIISVNGEKYAMQLSSIVGITQVSRNTLHAYCATNLVSFCYAGKAYRVVYMGKLLGITDELPTVIERRSMPLLILRGAGFEYAILVDEILGNKEMVIKSLGPQFTQLAICSGGTIMADGEVVMILDAVELSAKYRKVITTENNQQVTMQPNRCNKKGERKRSLILVVDDSVTVRKVTSSLLTQNNYQVITAKDGMDALSKINRELPDLILLDIEMPRMDGFELATFIRGGAVTRDIPLVMITSRAGKKHRLRAKTIGVNYFLGKPYQKDELLNIIKGLLTEIK